MTIAACQTPVVTPGVVVFDPVAFKADYPSFVNVSTGALQFNFTQATLLLNNTCGSVVCDAPTREMLLNLLVAHITALLNGVNGQPPSGIVGRISDATEGSVSVTAELTVQTTSMYVASLSQTQWGLMYLAATARFRSMRYVAAPQRNYGPWPFGTGVGYGPGGYGPGGYGGNC